MNSSLNLSCSHFLLALNKEDSARNLHFLHMVESNTTKPKKIKVLSFKFDLEISFSIFEIKKKLRVRLGLDKKEEE